MVPEKVDHNCYYCKSHKCLISSTFSIKPYLHISSFFVSFLLNLPVHILIQLLIGETSSELFVLFRISKISNLIKGGGLLLINLISF